MKLKKRILEITEVSVLSFILNRETSSAIRFSISSVSTPKIPSQKCAWIQHCGTLSYPLLHFQTLTFIENMDVTVT